MKGRLDVRWETVFEGMTVVPADDVAAIFGAVADRAAPHGLPAGVRDLGLVLPSVKAGEDDTEFF